MTTSTTSAWESKRTDETRMVEQELGRSFERVDSYRYNSASIRVRVIDSHFAGVSRDEREKKVEQQIEKLPEATQRDIVTILCFAPDELKQTPKNFREFMLNAEFDEPSESVL
jgi:hypothetical protein